MDDHKAVLARYLQLGRDALLWKLEGLSDYDLRRPMTRTGTNLLGVLKHVASVEAGYLGDCFGRPFPEPFPWFAEDAEVNADFMATQSREEIVGLYRRVWEHSDATIAALPLDAVGAVPWWPEERRQVSLQQILVHMTVETHRHAGHMDVARELIDGGVGYRPDAPNLPDEWGEAEWADYRDRLEAIAKAATS